MAKKNEELEVEASEEVAEEAVETAPEEITEVAHEFGREDLNSLRDTLNQLVRVHNAK